MSCIINAGALWPLIEYPVAADSLAFIVAYDVMEAGRPKIFQSCQPAGSCPHNANTLTGIFSCRRHGSVNSGYNPSCAVHIISIIIAKGIKHKAFFVLYAAEIEDPKSYNPGGAGEPIWQ